MQFQAHVGPLNKIIGRDNLDLKRKSALWILCIHRVWLGDAQLYFSFLWGLL